MEQRINVDTTDHSAPSLPCPDCSAKAEYSGRQNKTFQTALGEMTLTRAYYHCKSCCSGFFPRDHTLGLVDTSLSPALVRMTGLSAAMVSFADSSTLIRELAGVDVNAKQAERTAEMLGHEIAEYEMQSVEPEYSSSCVKYLGVDGTGIPVRKEEVKGRQGKQADGSAKTREVKLVCGWTADSRDNDGQPRKDPGSVTYSAAIESAAQKDTDHTMSEFAQRVVREAQRRDFYNADCQVILGDGAVWIWNMADEYFPHAVQIVDIYHAKEHLHGIAKIIYGGETDLGKEWSKQRCDELDKGKINNIIQALNSYSETFDEVRLCRGYFLKNMDRMQYDKFKARGLMISSGIVEAGCKSAIGHRLKRAGMHWTVKGANSIIALRCCILSGLFEDFWEHKIVTTNLRA